MVARLDELLLEYGDLPGRPGQAASQEPDLFFQEFHLGLELVHLFFVPFDLLVSCHRVTFRAAPEFIPGL